MGALIEVAVPLAVVIVLPILKLVVPLGANHTLPPVSPAEAIVTETPPLVVLVELNTVF